jgi:site-specific DNA recombinase
MDLSKGNIKVYGDLSPEAVSEGFRRGLGGGMQRAAGYVRVSTPGQAAEGESQKTQDSELRRYCRANEIELVNIHADEGISGADIQNRPALLELLEHAREGRFQLLIVHRLSRLARNARQLLEIVETLNSYGVRLVSIKENLDFASPVGKALLTMLAAVSELEKETIREQMAENKMVRWREGRAFLGRPSFGYRRNRETKSIEVVPKEAEIYTQIVDWYLDEGLSFLNIALRLKDRGIRLARSYPKPSTIQYLLKNPIYTGVFFVNQYQYENGKRTKKLKPATEHIAVHVQPLIDRTRWDAIQERIKHNTSKSKRVTAAKNYWLRDILECDLCGATLKPHHGSIRKDGGYPRSCVLGAPPPKLN